MTTKCNAKIVVLFVALAILLMSLACGGINISIGYPTSTPTGVPEPTDTPVPSNTVTLAPTSTQIPTATNRPTLKPTSTQLPTSTPVPGSFDSPLTVGDKIALAHVPAAYSNSGKDEVGEMEFELLEFLVGEEANTLAKKELDWIAYEEPIDGQEYLAARAILRQIWYEDNTELVTIYPYMSITLRYKEGGNDTWSIWPVYKLSAEGYPPLEVESWIFFRIREGSHPYIYFQPVLMVSEQLGLRDTGAYFKLFDQ